MTAPRIVEYVDARLKPMNGRAWWRWCPSVRTFTQNASPLLTPLQHIPTW